MFTDKIKQYFNPHEYPTNEWYRQHLERNYDMIILGDSLAKSITPQSSSGKVFNFSLKGQSLAMDFMVLQQTFSILKEKGTALFILSSYACCFGWEKAKDLRPYYWLFWPYYIAKNPVHLFYIRVCKRIPIVMLRPYDMYHLLWKYTEEEILSQEMEYEKVRLLKLTPEKREIGIGKTITLIKEIVDFCVERNIAPVFSFGSFNLTPQDAFLEKEVKMRFPKYIVDFSELKLQKRV